MTTKRKRHLTLEGFLRKFAKIAKRRGFRVSEYGFIRDRWGCCPINAVARSEGAPVDHESYMEGADYLGLREADARDVAHDADYETVGPIRARLLKACEAPK